MVVVMAVEMVETRAALLVKKTAVSKDMTMAAYLVAWMAAESDPSMAAMMVDKRVASMAVETVEMRAATRAD